MKFFASSSPANLRNRQYYSYREYDVEKSQPVWRTLTLNDMPVGAKVTVTATYTYVGEYTIAAKKGQPAETRPFTISKHASEEIGVDSARETLDTPMGDAVFNPLVNSELARKLALLPEDLGVQMISTDGSNKTPDRTWIVRSNRLEFAVNSIRFELPPFIRDHLDLLAPENRTYEGKSFNLKNATEGPLDGLYYEVLDSRRAVESVIKIYPWNIRWGENGKGDWSDLMRATPYTRLGP